MMLNGACVAMAIPYLLNGIWQRREAHLFFVMAAVAVIVIALEEMFMIRANSVDDFARVLRWIQLPILILVIRLVGFVRLYLGTRFTAEFVLDFYYNCARFRVSAIEP
jgi:hypothetical protein